MLECEMNCHLSMGDGIFPMGCLERPLAVDDAKLPACMTTVLTCCVAWHVSMQTS
jgi:hypothetical protein